jgi:hypothetical protein
VQRYALFSDLQSLPEFFLNSYRYPKRDRKPQKYW